MLTHDEARAAHAIVEHRVDELQRDVEPIVGRDGAHDADDSRHGQGGEEDGLAPEPVRQVAGQREP